VPPVSWRERHLAKVRRLEEAAAAVVLGELDVILDKLADGIGATTAAADDEPAADAGSPDDLSGMQAAWMASVDGVITPYFERVYSEGAEAAVEQITETTGATVPPADPDMVNEAALRHLAEARPRFVELGDEAWNRARSEMVQAVAAGEDLGATRRRIRDVTGLTRARADALARTEVIAASNAGSMSRVRLMPENIRPGFKQWLCVTGDTRVWSPQPREVVKRRRPPGPLVRLKARTGDILTVTPQHPVLTQRGWVPAHEVEQGDYLVRHRNVDAVVDETPGPSGPGWTGLGHDPHVDHPPPRIDELHRTAAQRWPDRRVMTRVVDLDCGGADCEVEVVPADGDLLVDGQAVLTEPGGKNRLVLTDVALGDLVASGAVGERLVRHTSTLVGSPDGVDAARLGSGAVATGSHTASGALVATHDVGLIQPACDGGLGDTPSSAELAHAVSLGVALDEVVEVSRWVKTRGHDVYDLSTNCGWFVANGFIVHNSTMDNRTRPTHAAADGQVVERDQRFEVGVAHLDYPGDYTGPPDETINCRCTCLFVDSPEALVVEGRQQGGIVDLTDVVPPPSAGAESVRGGSRMIERTVMRWRDRQGALAESVPFATADVEWTPPSDARCAEEGCGRPATARRPLTANIVELVCAGHAGTNLAAANVDSITGEVHTGSMIALVPSEADAERLAVEGGESPDQLHVTMWFLGEAADMTPELQQAIRSGVELRSQDLRPLEVNVFGASVWNPNGDRGGSLNWNVGGDGLREARDEMRAAVVDAPGNVESDIEAAQAWEMVENHTPWAAHMCAMYAPTDDLVDALPAALERVGPVTLDRMRLTFGGEVIDIPLGTSQDADVEDTAAAAAAHAETGENTMGETADQDAAVPKPAPFKRAKKGAGGQCPPGYRPDGDDCVSTTTPAKDDAAAGDPAAGEADEAVPEATKPQPLPGEHFRATMHVQNVSTGRRTFKNLTWREPPFAFHRQKNSSAHGGVPEVVQTGLVSRVVQDGDTLYGFGPLDVDSDEGVEHARRLVAGFDRWVSIGLDEQPSNVEVVWPAGAEDEDGMAALFAEPEQIIFDGGRIGELTSVSVPAQDQATVEPTAELIRLMEQRGAPAAPAEADVLTASVTGSTDLPVGDRAAAWDGAAAMNRVWAAANDGEDTAMVSRAFLYRDPDADPKTKAAWKLGFADVVDGTLTIIPRGVAAVAGGRGVNAAAIPDADKASIRTKVCTLYGKVRNVHEDWGDCPFDSSSDSQAVADGYTFADTVQALTAAAWRIEVAEVPPRWWYDEPTDVPMDAALNITDEGRIFAVLAPMGVGHRAFANSGRRMEVPIGNVDYDRFMGGWAITSKGKIAAGPITMDCGHADRFRTNHDVAPAHYDNSCTVFGTVRVGENRDKGYVWAAGSLAPGITPDQLARALACRLSGDWQPHPERAGAQELIAALLVPSPGFPMAHAGPSLSVGEEILAADGVLVASSVHAEVPVRQASSQRPALRIDPTQRRVERFEAS
jgi:hypothetical protein